MAKVIVVEIEVFGKKDYLVKRIEGGQGSTEGLGFRTRKEAKLWAEKLGHEVVSESLTGGNNMKTKSQHTPGPHTTGMHNHHSICGTDHENGTPCPKVILDRKVFQEYFTDGLDKKLRIEALLEQRDALLEAAKAAEYHICSTFECGEDRRACPVRGFLRAAIAKCGEGK